MIHVVVNVELAPGLRDIYLQMIQGYMAECRNEAGCLGYEAAIPLPTPGGVADWSPADSTGPSENVVMLLTKWASIAAYERHFDEPHVRQCTESVRHIVRGVDIQVLQPVGDEIDHPSDSVLATVPK
jgi:quinol monooxygenase YgiN